MKIKLFPLCIVLLAGCFFACKKETTSSRSSIPQTDKQLIQQVTQMAAFHNQGLAYIYEGLKTELQATGASTAGKLSDVRPPWDPGPLDPAFPPGNIIIDYNYRFMKEQLNINIDSVYSVNPDILYDSIDVKSQLWDHAQYWLSDYVKYMFEFNMSPTLATALNNFQSLVESTSDTTQILSQGDVIINNNVPVLQDTLEKILLIAIVKTGTNSAAYWQVNYARWQALAASYDGTYARTTNDDIKDAIFDDIIGAAGGAIRGAVIGGTGGTLVVPGVGTVAGAAACGMLGMVGGAVTSSATSYFWGKFKKWVDWYNVPMPGSVYLNYYGENIVIKLPVNPRITLINP